MIYGVVFTALKGLVANRCYPNTFPQGAVPVWPAIRYTLVTAVPDNTLCGSDVGETDEYHVQIDVVALTQGAASALADQVMAALQDTDPPATRDSKFETFDPETKTHRVVLDYLFHPSSD